ncbi:MAG: hypothetical protein K2W96_03795 [Gemmataceae bacterium]|nr:hypothetical protein [Gemmataceae bacterium]
MFAIVGQAGNVILFVCVGLLWIGLAAFLVALGARAWLVTAQGTAAGVDEVLFPDESPIDWFRQSAYLLGILAVFLIPAGFLSRGLAQAMLPEDTPLRTTILVGLSVWLLFPLGLLSMQRANALPRLLAKGHYLIGYYLLTGGVLAVCLGLLYLGMFSVIWGAVPFAAVFGAAGLLVHARLLGRLGWLLTRDDLAPQPSPKARKKRKKVRAEVADPWAEPEEAEAVPPVALAREIEEPKPRRPSYEEEPPDPYAVADLPPSEPMPAQVEMRKDEIEREVALRTRRPPAPPTSVLFSGVWEYPFYGTSRKPLALLAIWGMLVLWLGRIVVTLYPG